MDNLKLKYSVERALQEHESAYDAVKSIIEDLLHEIDTLESTIEDLEEKISELINEKGA